MSKATPEFHAGFVLHTRPFRNSSLLIDFFCQQLGRTSLVAHGVKRPQNAWAGLLQPFMPLRVLWTGQRDLKTLVLAESLRPPLFLKSRHLICALYLNEILVRLLKPSDPEPVLFAAYESALQQLAEHGEVTRVLREFELQLLSAQGFGIDFEKDCEGVDIDPTTNYIYHSSEGFIAITPQHVLANEPCYTGAQLKAVGCAAWEKPQILAVAKTLCRQALAPLLGNRPLLSRELLQ